MFFLLTNENVESEGSFVGVLTRRLVFANNPYELFEKDYPDDGTSSISLINYENTHINCELKNKQSKLISTNG